MNAFLLSHETALRLGAFFGVLMVMAALEAIAPRRRRDLPRLRRWPSNLGLVVLNSLLLRALFPAAAIGLAVLVETGNGGLLRILEIPFWARVAISVVLLDFIIYLQHVLFHAVPLLWRLHRMHHSDVDLDVTSGARFHPVEILLSFSIKCAAITALGAPPLAVLLFEVVLNATAMFNHANWHLAPAIDRYLRLLVVTPDMHRIHHSRYRDEANCNFGFNLPWWDRLLGTYRAQPRDGQVSMTLGLAAFREAGEQRLDRLLAQPLRATGEVLVAPTPEGNSTASLPKTAPRR